MSKILIRVLTVAAAIFGTTTLALAASTPCTTTLTGAIAGDVVVPSGASCTLDDVTVTGDVIVQAGASLYVRSSATRSMVRGDVRAHDCNVVGLGNGVPYVNPENPYGKVVIGGNVHISGCTGSPSSGCAGVNTGYALISPVPATVLIGGNFRCSENPSGCYITACTIGGNLQCSSNTGCIASVSTIAGDATVNDNLFFQLTANEVAGDLKCNGNSSGIGGFNIVAGTVSGQCSALP
jgi:hypothetical protein